MQSQTFIVTWALGQHLPSGRPASGRYLMLDARDDEEALKQLDKLGTLGGADNVYPADDLGQRIIKERDLREVISDGWADVSLCENCEVKIVWAMSLRTLQIKAYDAKRSGNGTYVLRGRAEGYPLVENMNPAQRFGRRDTHETHACKRKWKR